MVFELDYESIQCRLPVAKTNGGFAQAVNTGMQTATTDWVVLLNSDVYPHQNFMQPLLRWVSHANLFAVGCRIERSDGVVEKVSWVRRRLRYGAMTTLPWHQQEFDQLAANGQAVATLYAAGGSMLLNRQKFLQLGGFEPLFEPYYYEDTDLGIRAWRRGWQVLADPSSRVIHDSGQTIDQVERANKVSRVSKRNKLLINWLHIDTPTLLLLSLPRVVLKSIGWAIKGRWLELQAVGAAVARAAKISAARKTNKAVNRYSLRQALVLVSNAAVVKVPLKTSKFVFAPSNSGSTRLS